MCINIHKSMWITTLCLYKREVNRCLKIKDL
nr:MAG TPA: hypothetical protein [Caudoviricetes sp.]